MKISITMYSYHRTFRKGGMNVEEFIRRAGQLGVEGVDLLSYFWRDEEREVERVGEWLSSVGLKLAAYAVGNNFVAGGREEFEKAVETVERGIETTARLGALVLRVFGGTLPEGVSPEEALQRAAEGLRRCLPLAREKNVILAVENHGGMPGTSQELRRLIELLDTPFVRACVDIGNFLDAGEEAGPAVEATAHLAAHVHLKDFRILPADSTRGHKPHRADWRLEPCALGEGDVPLPRCLKAFKNVGYTGFLSVEYEGIDEDEEAGVQRSLRVLRQQLELLE